MPDTKRLKSTLQALLADNVTGDISAQDVRDVLESLDLSRAACYWTAFATTTMTLQGSGGAGGSNYYRLQGTTVNKVLNRFTHATPGRLTYTGPTVINADLFAAFTFSIAGISAQDIAFQFYVNGVANTPSYQVRNVTTTLKSQIVVLSEVLLNPTDYVELWVSNETSAAKILTPVAGYINVQEMPLA